MDQAIIGSNRKIDPNRRAHLKADLTPDDNDRVEIGPTAMAYWRMVLGYAINIRRFAIQKMSRRMAMAVVLRLG